MKRERVSEEGESKPLIPRGVLESFYRNFFKAALTTVVYRLGTCDGRFQLFQREITPRIEKASGASLHLRRDVYRTLTEVQEALVRLCPASLQFGAIFPGHHLEGHPPAPSPRIDNAILQYQMNRDVACPRDFDRYVAFGSKCASPYGEMVIDVDMSAEYSKNPLHYNREGICECGERKQVCDTCWSVFMNPAQRVLDHIYRFFGLTAKFRVFSGRRGFHDWLINKRIVTMSSYQREAFYESIQWQSLTVGSELHDALYGILAPLFDANPVLRSRLKVPPNDPSYEEKHRVAVFDNLYPKMDREVSVDQTHPHKLPLTLHPETGNLCVVMFPVGSKYECVPSKDSIHYTHIRMDHIKCGVRMIEKALEIAARDK